MFIGRNDQGKSSILEALDIFINEGKTEEKDLNVKAQREGKNEFRIGVVFDDPGEIIIDATNKTRLKEEYLLNSEGYLEIWKSFRNGKSSTFISCKHPSNDDFLKNLLTKKIKDLQDFVDRNNINVNDKRKAAEIRKAIRNYYSEKDKKLVFSSTEIPIDAEGLKEIWDKLQNYLPVYALFHSDRRNVDQDEEIQDPLKVKIDEIFKRNEIQEKLNEIAREIDSEIKTIANLTVSKYKELTQTKTEIVPNIPEVNQLKWKEVYKNIGYNTNDNIPLNKRGSGVRRLVLLSSFLADMENKRNPDTTNHVIYAIEEPETSLHPDLQQKLINALFEFSNSGDYQIMLTTHSPALIRLFETSDVRFIEQIDGNSQVFSLNETVIDKIIGTMGLLPSIGKVVVCVEGRNDENFLLNINQQIDELRQIVDLKSKIDCGLLVILPMNGSNLKNWIDKRVFEKTNVLEFHIYDRDNDEKYKDDIKKVNNKEDGSFATLTKKREIENYVPKEKIEKQFKIEIKLDSFEKWDDVDVPQKVLKGLGYSENTFDKEACDKKEKWVKNIICTELSKNITKNDLESLGAWDEVSGWLKKISELVSKAPSK